MPRQYREFPYTPHSVLPYLASHIGVIQWMKEYWYIIINQSLYFIRIALVLTQCSFSVLGSHPGAHIVFCSHVSFGFSRLAVFLVFLMTLTFWEALVKWFVESFSIWVYLTFSLCVAWDCSFLWGRSQSKVPFSSRHMKGTPQYHQCDLPLLMLPPITWSKEGGEVSPLLCLCDSYTCMVYCPETGTCAES